MFKSYRDLEVYKSSFALAVEIHKRSQDFPKNEQYGGLADQIRRASKSICANIAEGLARRSSKAEEMRFLSIALGSCEEVKVWLDFCLALHYLGEEEYQVYSDKYADISRMLFGLMQRRKA